MILGNETIAQVAAQLTAALAATGKIPLLGGDETQNEILSEFNKFVAILKERHGRAE